MSFYDHLVLNLGEKLIFLSDLKDQYQKSIISVQDNKISEK
jgi:hypothetical protein